MLKANTDKTDKPRFEESLKNLEELLVKLEDPALPLDELIVNYERAKKSLAECKSLLDEAELKVKTLSKDGTETEFNAE